ncbi:uncharacterized protein Pyn_27931 [Prunus yedoensis var. nudiflora]|uniref:Uncharacterized protein n=1 Tax=Prunus yedoensis var. nudiflora TaxID=2094558 RepID=A0A314YQ45_PRUYE|nr:uncharacterized protein Pyn_27931 [Prunus yedoensis var. nudiflora]
MATNISDAEPLATAFARAPKKHNTSAFCYKFFYGLAERTGDLGLLPGFARPSLGHVQGRGRGLPAKLRGTTVRFNPDGPTSSQSINRLSSWRADVSQQHGVANITFQLQQGMTFLNLMPWRRRNAYDEDGRVWYEECISARFIRPDGEAARAALKNADWDPLTPKGTKVKKVSAGPPRPSTAAVVAPRATVPPSAGAAVAALTTAPTLSAAPAPRAAPVVGARKTLAHRTVPSSPSARSAAAVAPGRKRSREASSAGAAPVEAAPARVAAVEMAAVERPRKRTLFTSPEGGMRRESLGDCKGSPPVADVVIVEEEAAAEVPYVEETAAVQMVVEELGAAEVAVEEEATAERPVEEMTTTEIMVEAAAVAEAVIEEVAADEVVAEEVEEEAGTRGLPRRLRGGCRGGHQRGRRRGRRRGYHRRAC